MITKDYKRSKENKVLTRNLKARKRAKKQLKNACFNWGTR